MSDTIRKSDMLREYNVHTPNYDPLLYLINPDLTLLEGIVPETYWKISGELVVEMSQDEKSAASTDQANPINEINAAASFGELVEALGTLVAYVDVLEARLLKLEIQVLKDRE